MHRIGAWTRLAVLPAVVSAVAIAAWQIGVGGGAPALPAAFSGSLLSSPFVVTSGEGLLEGQQVAAEAVRRADPYAAFARQRSRTAYAHLDTEGVRRLLESRIPAAVARPSVGALKLPSGARVLGYASSHAVAISLPGHLRGIVESSLPVAKRTSHGRYTPINLAVKPSGTGFGPADSDLAVRIPRQLSAGVSIPADGIALTPLGLSAGAGGSGSVVGGSVVYANTQPATDAVVKPTATGFQLDAVLRSDSSPQQLLYRVEIPPGARLVRDSDSGIVRVVRGAATLATISPPNATDAAGAQVPASMRVSGRTLAVDVSHRQGSYLYPVDVDPEINDSQLAETTGKKRSNWQFTSSNEARFGHKAVYEGPGKERLESYGTAEYAATEFAYWAYETKGNSKIYELKAKTSAKNKGNKIESFLEFQSPSERESKKLLSNEFAEPEYAEKTSTICAWNASKVEECLGGAGKEKNGVRFQQSATAPPGGNFKFSDTMSEGVVSISEPSSDHATTRFNTTSPEVEGEVIVEGKKVVQKRVNALYGSGSWLTNTKGALQLISKDPGIGVSATHLEYEGPLSRWERLSEHNYLEVENGCQGVQCYPEHAEYWTLDPKLPDGEDRIRYRAQDAMPGTESPAEEASSTATIKVDTKAPHRLLIEGLPYGNELTERAYKLSTKATDGEGTTIASSGIPGIVLGSKGEVLSKGLALYVDGREVSEVGKQTGCTVAKGECTATAEWTINGSELGAGHHAIVLVTIDNAGNEYRISQTLSVRHSTPVALGPGSVDLQSGDFALGATDVTQGSGLTVARNYSSRATETGDEGPLGPQWNIDLGTAENLVEMVDGGVLLTDANGKQTIFAPDGTGGFEAPAGDSNLKLTLEENKETKAKLAYYLEDAIKHSKTKFTLPDAQAKQWMPAREEGTAASDTVTYVFKAVKHAEEFSTGSSEGAWGITNGADGNIWYTNKTNNKIGKMSVTGTVLAEYSTSAPPSGITTAADGDVWAIIGENKMEMITPSGTQIGVERGSGAQIHGITAGTGNVWFTESNGTSQKIGRVFDNGAVSTWGVPKGIPQEIAPDASGNMWFTTESPARVDRWSNNVITEYTVPTENSTMGGIVLGADGNMWFAETSAQKIGKITPSGAITEYSLPSSSYPPDPMAAGPDGNVWFIRGEKLGKITPSGTVTEFAAAAEFIKGLMTGSDGKLWYTGNRTGKLYRSTISTEISEPAEILAPVPTGVSCSPEMKAGCRALKFTYATTTTATGEGQAEWGQHKDRLSKVLLDAYDPSSKKMLETPVAEYSYDKIGRLRAAWDPRISPALKTTYGYDQEGHLTALTDPGQESWAFTYGTIAGDSGTGRLLKAMQASTSTELWKGEAVAMTASPQISGTFVEGSRLAASTGSWSGKPISYSYQWNDCSSDYTEACTPIAGATNPNYTPQASDAGRMLTVSVTATNGDGSVTASSPRSWEIESQASRFIEYNLSEQNVNGEPKAITEGPEGNMWLACGKELCRITPEGTVSAHLLPAGKIISIARGSDGNIWFGNENGKIGKFVIATSTFTEYALPAGSSVKAMVKGPEGNLWYANGGTGKVGKMTTTGVATEYGSEIYGGEGIAVGPDNNLWATDSNGFGRIDKITTAGVVTKYDVYINNEGHLERVYPTAIAAGPDGNLWYSESGRPQVGKITTSGAHTLYPAAEAFQIVKGADGSMWLGSANGALGRITTSGVFKSIALPGKASTFGLAQAAGGYLWYTAGYHTVGKVDPTQFVDAEAKTPQPGMTMEYNVPLTGGSGRPNMTAAQAEKWGQTDVPVEATAVFPTDEPQGWPASGYSRATIHYLDEQGHEVNTSAPSTATNGTVSTTEYNEMNDVMRTLSPANRQTALEAGTKSVEVAKSLSTYFSYREECSKASENKHEAEGMPGARLCDVEGPQHTIKYMAGKEQRESLGRLHTKYFYDEESLNGEMYNLQTKSSTLAALANEEEVEVRKTVTSYSGQSNLGWKLRAPTSVTVDPEGKKLTTTTLYNSVTGQIAETRAPAGSAGGSPHDTKYVYYTAEANTEGYPACGGHPEWAGLMCEALPAKQPETAGVPNLPVVMTTSYNMYNEPLTITETFGSTVRTKTKTYDEAGRLKTSETTSTANTALPKLTDEYSTTSGVLEKLSTTVGEKTQTITSKYNTVGQLTEYTDADGSVTKFRYAGPENDGLLEEVSDGSNGGTGKQTYSYNSTTKQLEELTDSSAGVFKASYDAEGRMVSETYPNAMCADSTYNSVGEAIKVEYLKTSVCSEHTAPVWFTETRVPSVRGETFSRSSTLANETYVYDSVGRLTETGETPAGEGCTVRLYAYDEEANRTSQTTRAPGAEGKCAIEGGTTLSHTYDAGNRLTDAGVSYDSFGDLTNVPAADAEGHALSSAFYVDGAVASQTQNGVTNNYYLDPEGRIRETVAGANATISHYDGAGEAVAWTSEGPGKYTRNIPGIDGTLAAVQTNGGTPVLQLHDLEGNVTATAALSPTETKLLSTYNSTEFGVPNKEKAPPKYAWLGAGDIASSLSSGVITYGATSYVPQIGRALQSEVVEAPGIAPHGTGAGAAYIHEEEPWMFQGASAAGAEAPGLEAAREQAAFEASLQVVDPVVYMNRTKADAKAKELLKIATVAEVLSILDIPKTFSDVIEKEILDKIGLDVALAWYHDAGDKLEKCAQNKRKVFTMQGEVKANICRFEYSNIEFTVPLVGWKAAFVYFPDEPMVDECYKTDQQIVCPWEVHVYKYLG